MTDEKKEKQKRSNEAVICSYEPKYKNNPVISGWYSSFLADKLKKKENNNPMKLSN